MNVQSTSVASYESTGIHVKNELAGEDDFQEEDVLAKEEEAPADEETSAALAGLGLSEEILDTVTRMGFTTPTPIRAEVIPALLELNGAMDIA